MSVELAAAVVPYVGAAVAAYGSSVVDRLRESAADATVGLGSRLLRRLLGRPSVALSAAVTDLAEDPADEDRVAALRLQIRKVLDADPALAASIKEMLAEGGVSVTAAGERSIAAQTISGVAVTGDDAHITR